MPKVSQTEIQNLIDTQPFLHIYGLRVTELTAGTCTLRVPFNPAFERPGGYVSGPLFMAAADAAMWFAILTYLPNAQMSVTTDLTTAFLKSAREEDFFCKASIVKLGQRIIYGTAECFNEEGQLLTHHTISYVRREEDDVA